MTRCAECIVADVARAFDVTPGEMVQHYRDRRLAYPRFAAYRLLRDRGLTTPQIGRMLGKRDHSTIIHGLERAETLLRTDPEFAARYEEARG